ncbi:MAG: hypothetical protein ACLSG9_03965 [Eubacterium sp.]
MEKWGDKPYHSLDYENKKRFGEKVYKFLWLVEPPAQTAMARLVQEAVAFAVAAVPVILPPPKEALPNRSKKPLPVFPVTKTQGIIFTAYFQSFTATYAPIETLRAAWEEAMTHESVVTLAIATRPDCLGDDVLSLLADCCRKMPVTVELGLQTIHPDTIRYIRQGLSKLRIRNSSKKSAKYRCECCNSRDCRSAR